MATPLNEVQLAEDEIVVEGFQATVQGRVVTVTAVLERTCVYMTPEGERRLANKSELLVEPDELTIRKRRGGPPTS